jgi:hypothetical protein
LTALVYKGIYLYMTPATNKHQQLILLEPSAAKLLDELSGETRIPKQVLLREAVNDLLAKHAKAESAWYADIVMALKLGKTIASRYQSLSDEVNWKAKCEELRKRANEILASLGKLQS